MTTISRIPRLFLKAASLSAHITFLTTCIKEDLVPNGFLLKFKVNLDDPIGLINQEVTSTLLKTSRSIMKTTLKALSESRNKIFTTLRREKTDFTNKDPSEASKIWSTASSQSSRSMKIIQARHNKKLDQLRTRQEPLVDPCLNTDLDISLSVTPSQLVSISDQLNMNPTSPITKNTPSVGSNQHRIELIASHENPENAISSPPQSPISSNVGILPTASVQIIFTPDMITFISADPTASKPLILDDLEIPEIYSEVCSKGPSFSTSPPFSPDLSKLKQDIEDWAERFRWKYFWRNETPKEFIKPPWYKKTDRKAPKASATIELFISNVTADLLNPANIRRYSSNVPIEERSAITEMKHLPENNIGIFV